MNPLSQKYFLPVAFLVALTMFALVACDDDEDGGDATAEATSPIGSPTVPGGTAEPTETAEATPTSPIASPSPQASGGDATDRTTGDAQLDPIVEAVRTGDVDALVSMTVMQAVDCDEQATEESALQCPEGSSAGTVDAVPVMECIPGWTSDPQATFEGLVEVSRGLYAAVEAPDDVTNTLAAPTEGEIDPEYWGTADHYLVFFAEGVSRGNGYRLHVAGGEIVGIWSGCNHTVEDLVRTTELDEYEIVAGPYNDPLPAEDDDGDATSTPTEPAASPTGTP